MKEYHKIQTVFKRDPATNHKTVIEGEWALPEFEYLQNTEWKFTEKVDGTNIRIMFSGGKVTFGGKTDNAQIPAPLIAKLQETFLPLTERFAETWPEGNVCFYGEGYGAKIQKGGGNYRPDQSFVLFDVKVGDWWLRQSALEQIACHFTLEIVPLYGRGTLHDMVDIVKRGVKSAWGDFLAEGIVARPTVELFARNGSRIITKLKHKDFRAV